MENHVERSTQNGCAILKYEGYIDSATFHIFHEAIEKTLADGFKKIIVDLSEVTFMSSAGWGSLLGNMQKVRSTGGDIYLARLPENLQSIFEISDFNKVIQSFHTVDGALAAFSGK